MRLVTLFSSVLVIAGCSHTPDPGPSLSITPSVSAGTLTVSGPTPFDAVLVDSHADVTWSVSGAGTLSGMTGLHVVYTPPPGSATATLTASTADGLSASVQLASKPVTLTGATIPGLGAPVTVQYDAEDIPHIRCQTANDCYAVQGYVQARDRLFMMDFLRHVAHGTLAELIGIDGLSQDVELRTLFTTRDGHRVEDDLAAAMDAKTAASLAAYVSGVNAYLTDLRANPKLMPGEYAQLPFPITPADVADWTVQDTLALARLQQFQLSETIEEESAFGTFAAVYGPGGPLQDLGKLAAWIRAAAPAGEQAHTLSPTAMAFAPHASGAAPAPAPQPGASLAPWRDVLAATRVRFDALAARLRPIGAAVGSNNWVISAAKSAAGAAMVANDPHLGLQYPPLFHLATLTSTTASDNLDLAGGSFPGIPGALVGRGAHVGWGVTVVGYDVTDLYLEQFLPQASCPSAAPCVLYKGAPTSTLPVPVTFQVRTAGGLVDAQALGLASPPPAAIVIVPQHGPVIQAPDAAGRAVSARWTGQEGDTDDLKAVLGVDTATDVDDAMAALSYFSTGAQNWVLADDQGHIAYDPHALVPVRTFADAAPHLPPWFPLPGDGSAEWGDGTAACAAPAAAATAACWIADDALPQGKDPAKGYFFTANADPTSPSVSDDNNPLAHPPYLSFDWDDSTGFRATRIQQRIEDALAANGAVSLDDMESIQADHVSRPGMAFAPFIAALPTSASDPPELTAAEQLIAAWGSAGFDCPSGLTGSDPVRSPADPTPSVVTSSSGCFLFHAFLRTLFTNVFTDDLRVAGQGVGQLQAMKAMLYMLTLPLNDPGASFCNDVNARGQTIATHACAEQVATALATAYDELAAQLGADPSGWVWGRVHTIQPVPLIPLVTNHYMPGPYARPGGAFTVDVGTPSTSAAGLAFPYSSGGNVRHISLMDPAKPVVKMQLPGPERDVPDLFEGPDLLGQWVMNTYFDFAFGDQIDAVAVSTQTFNAN